MKKIDICDRCGDIIEEDQEIWYPNGKASCGDCTTSEEIENYGL